MALLEWSSAHATGNPEVDGAHRLLIDHVNSIAARQPAGSPEQDELIQALVQLYRMMSDAARSAEAARQAKSRYLATVSHEIRTPLDAIIGLTHLAGLAASSERQRKLLQQSSQSAQHLMQITNDVLDLAKIESGKFAIVHADFSLEQVIDSALAMIRQKADDKGLALAVSIARPCAARSWATPCASARCC
jgi:signal transduction histidine kinase